MFSLAIHIQQPTNQSASNELNEETIADEVYMYTSMTTKQPSTSHYTTNTITFIELSELILNLFIHRCFNQAIPIDQLEILTSCVSAILVMAVAAIFLVVIWKKRRKVTGNEIAIIFGNYNLRDALHILFELHYITLHYAFFK